MDRRFLYLASEQENQVNLSIRVSGFCSAVSLIIAREQHSYTKQASGGSNAVHFVRQFDEYNHPHFTSSAKLPHNTQNRTKSNFQL